jgi:LPS-assembly lipoprotein
VRKNSEKLKVKSVQARSRSLVLFSALFTFHFSLVSCGFHLRGTAAYQLPPSLSTLRVVVAGSEAAHDPLKVAMETALRAQAGVTVSEAVATPTLTLSGERADSEVASVTAAGKAAEYRLRYALDFEVRDARGAELVARQSVQLLRDYTFDPRNVIAKEREERELRELLRRDAVQQVLRRLARLRVKSEK